MLFKRVNKNFGWPVTMIDLCDDILLMLTIYIVQYSMFMSEGAEITLHALLDVVNKE